LQSVPGVGPMRSMTWVAQRLVLETLSRQQTAALVGVAHLNRESRTWRGQRPVWGGRAQDRPTLDMGALMAGRHHPVFREFPTPLHTTRNAAKVELTVCRRTWLTIVNAMRKHRAPWQTNYASPS